MPGFIDEVKDKAQAATGDTRSRFEYLQQQEREGKLGIKGKAELNQLREQFKGHNQ